MLDVGCGTGLCLPRLQQGVGRAGLVIGIDASAEMLAVARRTAEANRWRNVVLVHSPYVSSFSGFDRPWSLLEEFVDSLWVTEVAWGTGYLALGRMRPERPLAAGSRTGPPATGRPA